MPTVDRSRTFARRCARRWRRSSREEVADYEFKAPEGTVPLSGLFDGHEDLMVVHNMGSSCPGCTLWADGYNGVHHHVVTRTGFVVSSPEAPALQQKFAASRGWKFRMVSHLGTSFAADMGYRSADGRWRPGVSVFRARGPKILRVSDASWSPGDDFCTVWHLLRSAAGRRGGLGTQIELSLGGGRPCVLCALELQHCSFRAARRQAVSRRFSCDEALRSRNGEQLNPVKTAPRGLARGIRDAHLGEAWVHDVFTVTRTVQPALDHFLCRFGTVGDIFTH